MSVALMAVCWRKQFDCHADKDVMIALCDHANDDGICWPSRAYIAWKIDRHPDTVKASLKKFRDAGIIEVRREANNDMARSPVIRVLPQDLPDKQPYKHGSDSSDRGAADPPVGGVTDPPKPSVEPSVVTQPKGCGETPGSATVSGLDEAELRGTVLGVIRGAAKATQKPLSGRKAKQYSKEFGEAFRAGREPDDLLLAAQRIAKKWEVKQLTVVQALTDVDNGKTGDGRAGWWKAPDAAIAAIKTHPEMGRYVELLKRWDPTTEEIPQGAFLGLGSDDAERWKNQARIESIARRAVRPTTDVSQVEEAIEKKELPDSFEKYCEQAGVSPDELGEKELAILKDIYRKEREKRG